MVESSVAARWSGMGSAVVRGFGRARAGVCLAAAPAASSRAVVGPKPGPGRRGGRLDILAALLLGAALAVPAWAQDIVHPRVLMDTQITVGGYRVPSKILVFQLMSTIGDMRTARPSAQTRWP